ncbi:MAG TPA: hypothetical protein PKZ79_12095 [Ottowia sp.]|nr:hypothetical protein [Ottowia sp.]
MAIYTVIAPTPIDPLPPLPVRGAPDWSAKAHAYVVKLKEDVQPQQNSLSLNVWNNALAAQEQADIASAAATVAQGAAQAAVAAAGAVPWQSGGSYTAGSYPATPPSCVYDTAEPNITYRCKVTHSGVATAPGSDTTNWVKLGETLLTLREKKVAMAANDIDMSAGGIFTKTITANTTFTVSNVPPSGTAGSFELRLTNAGSKTITFWPGCKWWGGVVPVLTASGVDRIGVSTDDGGTTYWLHLIGLDCK